MQILLSKLPLTLVVNVLDFLHFSISILSSEVLKGASCKCGKFMGSAVWSNMAHFPRQAVNLTFLWIFTYRVSVSERCSSSIGEQKQQVWDDFGGSRGLNPSEVVGSWRSQKRPNLLSLSCEIYRLFIYVHGSADLCVVQNILCHIWLSPHHMHLQQIFYPLSCFGAYIIYLLLCKKPPYISEGSNSCFPFPKA